MRARSAAPGAAGCRSRRLGAARLRRHRRELEGGYTKSFPSVHLTHDRHAATQSTAQLVDELRPAADDEPAAQRDRQRRPQTLTINNPSLLPQTAKNWDATLEYYFEPVGSVSVGWFHKTIKDYIVTGINIGTIGTGTDNGYNGEYGGFTRLDLANAGTAIVQGWEFSYQQQFTFLPGLLKGLGTAVNVTKLETHGDFGGSGDCGTPAKSGLRAEDREHERVLAVPRIHIARNLQLTGEAHHRLRRGHAGAEPVPVLAHGHQCRDRLPVAPRNHVLDRRQQSHEFSAGGLSRQPGSNAVQAVWRNDHHGRRQRSVLIVPERIGPQVPLGEVRTRMSQSSGGTASHPQPFQGAERAAVIVALVVYLVFQFHASAFHGYWGQDWIDHKNWIAFAAKHPVIFVSQYAEGRTNPPLFHLLGAAVRHVAGLRHYLLVLGVVNVLLGFAGACFAYGIIRRLIGSALLRVACLVFVLFLPFAMIHAQVVASDALATPLFFLLLWLVLRLEPSDSIGTFVAFLCVIALVVVLGVLTKFTFASTIPAVGAWALLWWRTGTLSRRRLIMLLLTVVLVPGLLAYRESVKFRAGQSNTWGIHWPARISEAEMNPRSLAWLRADEIHPRCALRPCL